MQEQIITFETAKLAKDKGFDIPTLYGCNNKGELQQYFTYQSYAPGEPEIWISDFIRNWDYQCPTQSLLQKWLRDTHNIMVIPTVGYLLYPNKFYFYYWRVIINNEDIEQDCTSEIQYGTYEDALEVGLQEALKLIK